MHDTHSQFHPPPRPPCHKAGSSNRLESSPTGWDPGPGQRMWIGYAYLFIFKMCIELFWYWNHIPLLMHTYWGHKSPANSIPYAAPVWGPTLGTSPFPAGWMRQLHEGIAESLPENIHVLSKTLKADLRNSWWETARKMERFLDSESKNQLTQREKSSDFSWCVSGAPFSGLFPA